VGAGATHPASGVVEAEAAPADACAGPAFRVRPIEPRLVLPDPLARTSSPSPVVLPAMNQSLRALSLAAVGLLVAPAAHAQIEHTVTQISNTFQPANITIDVGDSVKWQWTGGGHTVTEGTENVLDGSEAFHGELYSLLPVFKVGFSSKFLFENPRPGNTYPYNCIPHFDFGMIGSVHVVSPWFNLEHGLAGANGASLLWADGPLSPGSSNTLTLENGSPSALSLLFVGLTESATPFKGGTLVPVPIALQVPLFTQPGGDLSLGFTLPPGLTGVDLYLQLAMTDAGAPLGVALSNAVRATGT